jgi:hypothetical protein
VKQLFFQALGCGGKEKWEDNGKSNETILARNPDHVNAPENMENLRMPPCLVRRRCTRYRL